MLRFIFWIYIILSLIVPTFSTGASGNNKTIDSASVIQVKDSLLTVKVEGIPLKKILMDIAKQAPVKITYCVPAEKLIVADFSRLPMTKGLKLLLSDYNYAFTCGGEKSKEGEYEIINVIVISRDEESQHRNIGPMVASTEEPSLESPSKDLHDEDLSVREYAEDSLEKFEEDLRDEDPSVREYAIDSLVELDDPRSINLLVGVLHSDKDVDVRMSAVDALRDTGSEVAIDSLSKALQDEDVEVRESAVQALGTIGGDRAVRALEGALSDEDEDVREFTAEVLSWLKEEGETKIPLQ